MNTCTHRAVNCKFRMGRFELKTERSIYEFEEDQKCLTMAEGLIALDNAKLYFGNPDCMCICQKTMRLQK